MDAWEAAPPPYDAAPVVQHRLLRAHPALRDVLALMAGAIDDVEMRRMNRAVGVLRQAPVDVARARIDRKRGAGSDAGTPADSVRRTSGLPALAYDRRAEIGQKTLEHLGLAASGTEIAIAIGAPLGIVAGRRAATRGPVLALTEVVQAIPSLAMLAFLFAVCGLLGAAPAVTALVLHALLPIVLNTRTGLREVPQQVIEAANGVGMSNWQRSASRQRRRAPSRGPSISAGAR